MDQPTPSLDQSAALTLILRDKATGKRLLSLEGVAISDARTGWFATACLDLFLKGKHDIEVFLFGAGHVVKETILALDASTLTGIKRVAVPSRGGKSNISPVEKLALQVRLTFETVDDRQLFSKADYEITATNSGVPVFEADEITPSAVTLSLDIDDMPP